MLCAAARAWRVACCAVGGETPPSGAGTCAQSPSAQTSSSALDLAGWPSATSRPFFVFGSASESISGCGELRHRRDERPRRDALAARQYRLFARRAASSRVFSRSSTPRFASIFCAKSASFSPISGRIRSWCVQQHDADLLRVECCGSSVATAAHEVVQLGDDLDAREAAARDHERQELTPQLGVVVLDRRLVDRRGSRGCAGSSASARFLNGIACSGRPRRPAEVGDVAEREDQVIVVRSRGRAGGSRGWTSRRCSRRRSIRPRARGCSVRGSRRRSGLTMSVSPIVPEITSGSIGWKTK